MTSICVASYSVRVRYRHKSDRLQLGLKSGPSVYDVVLKTLRGLKSHQRHPKSPHVIKVSRIDFDGSNVWGLIERGEYGHTATGVNSKTFDLSYSRTVDDAELVPLYFRFHLPSVTTTGILILQRLGVHGSFGDLRDTVVQGFRDHHPEHILEMNRFVSGNILNQLKESPVSEISIITHTLPTDIASKLQFSGAQENVAKVEVRIRAKRDHFFGLPTRLINPDVSVAEVLGEPGRVRMRVDYKGHERTYESEGLNNIAPYIDVTEEVAKRSDGHPKFESIDAYCVGLQNDLIEQLGQEDKG